MNRNIHEQFAFAVFSSKYEFFGACHWTRVTKVWDILDLCGGDNGWVVYHNNQRLGHHRVSAHHGDVLLVMSATVPTPHFKLIVLGMMLPWRGLPMLQHRSPVKRLSLHASELFTLDAVGDDSHEDTATFDQTGSPPPYRQSQWSTRPR